MPQEVAETLTSTSSGTLARVDTSCEFQVLSSSGVHLTLVCGAGRGVTGLLIADRETQTCRFCYFSLHHVQVWWLVILVFNRVQPLHSVKLLKAHFVIPKATSVRKNAFFPSSLKKLTLADVWLEYNTSYFFFTSVSSKANPDEFPHLTWTGSKIWGSAAAESPGCTVCSQYTHIWLISLFGLLRCGRASHSIEERFWKPGHGDDTAAGGAARVSTGTAELGALREAEWGERSAVKSPTCRGTWKAWLTIPFEATGCKGAGHRQVRTKMDLIVRETPPLRHRVGEHWTGN